MSSTDFNFVSTSISWDNKSNAYYIVHSQEMNITDIESDTDNYTHLIENSTSTLGCFNLMLLEFPQKFTDVSCIVPRSGMLSYLFMTKI